MSLTERERQIIRHVMLIDGALARTWFWQVIWRRVLCKQRAALLAELDSLYS